MPGLLRALAVLFGLPFCAACGSSAARMPVDVPTGRAPSTESQVAADVGRLLADDPVAARDALRSLASLDAAGRSALAAHAARIPTETDPRWLEVLEAQGLVRALTPEHRLAWALWQVAEPEPGRVMTGQARLVELARTSPELLNSKLATPGPGRDAIAVGLAEAGLFEAVPALLALYRRPLDPRERRAAALALGRLAGDALRPRPEGTDEEIERDARKIDAWWQTREEASDGKGSS